MSFYDRQRDIDYTREEEEEGGGGEHVDSLTIASWVMDLMSLAE